MKTDINKLLAVPIMEEWAQFTPVVNMTPQEVDAFFTRMLACERYDNDQGELYKLKEAVKSWDHVKECNIGYSAKWGAVKEVRVDILDALADCWYFGFQWARLFISLRKVKNRILPVICINNYDYINVYEAFQYINRYNIDSDFCSLNIAIFLSKIIEIADSHDFPLHTAVERVHASNLSKRNDNGVFEYNEHGKIIKGKNYVPPVLDDLV